MSLKQKVDLKRKQRKHTNKAQVDAYSKTLSLVTTGREGDLMDEEIKCLNLMRIIIEGGWIIDS